MLADTTVWRTFFLYQERCPRKAWVCVRQAKGGQTNGSECHRTQILSAEHRPNIANIPLLLRPLGCGGVPFSPLIRQLPTQTLPCPPRGPTSMSDVTHDGRPRLTISPLQAEELAGAHSIALPQLCSLNVGADQVFPGLIDKTGSELLEFLDLEWDEGWYRRRYGVNLPYSNIPSLPVCPSCQRLSQSMTVERVGGGLDLGRSGSGRLGSVRLNAGDARGIVNHGGIPTLGY
jgi:hypothetical protein